MIEKGVVDRNAAYQDEYMSALQACFPRRPHGHEDLLPSIYDVEISTFQYAKGIVCFSSNDDAVIGN